MSISRTPPTEPAKAIPVPPTSLLHTTGGEMPDPEGRPPGTSEEDLKSAFGVGTFDEKYPKIIPESQGDLADRAERDIESDLQSNIDHARIPSRKKTDH